MFKNELLCVVAFFFLLERRAEACGPNLEPRVLLEADKFLLRGFEGDFVAEIRRLLPAPKVSFHYTAQSRSEVEQAEQAPASREVELYSQGAELWHGGDRLGAREKWLALLQLPEKQRRSRSTWAAFMLGRLEEDGRRWFAKTRQLARRDFDDRLGLAVASLGEEARLEYQSDRWEKAFHLYAEQVVHGDPNGAISLLQLTRTVLRDPVLRRRAARDALMSSVITAYLVSRAEHELEGELAPSDRAAVWLDTVEAAGRSALVGADRLAWLAYRAGRFDRAERWAKLAGARPVARWISMKLALRRGDDAAAADTLHALILELDVDRSGALLHRAEKELAVLTLSQEDYSAALALFLRAGNWVDSAYLAEKVLTLDELRRFIVAELPRTPIAEQPNYHRPDDLTKQLRGLFGRRLMREGHFAEGISYLPDEYRDDAQSYVRTLEETRQGSDEERAAAFWRAAKIAREKGLEILGTEEAPDWFVYEGQFDPPPTLDARRILSETHAYTELGPSSEEIRRASTQGPLIDRRWHYRYSAAELAWDGAALLPPSSERAAIMLCRAARWHIDLSPELARRFYREFLRRNYRFDWGGMFGRECPPLP